MPVKSKLIQWLQAHPRAKHTLHYLMMHPVKSRPRLWLRMLRFLYTKRGKGSVIYNSVRMDITPFHPFVLGEKSVIEDYTCVNNAVGELIIGDRVRIGLHNTIIGPVRIGNDVGLAQGIVVSGLNHNFKNDPRPIFEQGVNTSLITIEDDVWIGANSTITAGVTIGRHSVIGAGSVVTKDIPPFSEAVGNPARVIKRLNNPANETVS